MSALPILADGQILTNIIHSVGIVENSIVYTLIKGTVFSSLLGTGGHQSSESSIKETFFVFFYKNNFKNIYFWLRWVLLLLVGFLLWGLLFVVVHGLLLLRHTGSRHVGSGAQAQ